MGWTWTLEDTLGEVKGRSEEFESRGDAESWVGEEFETLLEQGVDQVRLFDGETEIYGPMSLHAQDSSVAVGQRFAALDLRLGQPEPAQLRAAKNEYATSRRANSSRWNRFLSSFFSPRTKKNSSNGRRSINGSEPTERSRAPDWAC